LLGHITGGADAETYQPMNINFGLMPPIEGRSKKADRKKMYTERARQKLAEWLQREKVAEPA
jgi:methylenetetrahydrofolate--tRNA-(uracil-5-)-methyltransferase